MTITESLYTWIWLCFRPTWKEHDYRNIFQVPLVSTYPRDPVWVSLFHLQILYRMKASYLAWFSVYFKLIKNTETTKMHTFFYLFFYKEKNCLVSISHLANLKDSMSLKNSLTVLLFWIWVFKFEVKKANIKKNYRKI